jgi:hypothetical protein
MAAGSEAGDNAHGELVWRGAGRRGRLGVWRWRGNQVRQGKVKGAINQEGGRGGREGRRSIPRVPVRCAMRVAVTFPTRNARNHTVMQKSIWESMFTHRALGLAST